MRNAGSGSVVNSSSVGGIRGVGQQAAYAASKHGIVGLTRNAAVEYAGSGVRINAIAPGAICGPMIEAAVRGLDPEDPDRAARIFTEANPTTRFGQPEGVASVVAFLLSLDATYVNGAVIPIDGGQSAKY